MMLIALLIICFIGFCVGLTKWYIYLENRGAVATMGLTTIPAGFISGFIIGLIGSQFGRKYIVPSTLVGTAFGILSHFILGVISTTYFRLFKPESFRDR